jgi:hypothetical protein
MRPGESQYFLSPLLPNELQEVAMSGVMLIVLFSGTLFIQRNTQAYLQGSETSLEIAVFP